MWPPTERYQKSAINPHEILWFSNRWDQRIGPQLGPSWAPDGGTEQDQQDDVSADEGLFLRTSDVDGPGVSQAVS